MAGTFVQEGLQYILEAALRGGTPISNAYMALVTDASVAANATWAGLTEVSGTGYARVACAASVVGFPTSAVTSTNAWHIKTKDCVFTAGGTWTGAKCAVLLTTNDGTPKIIAWGALAATRTLQNGDTETVSLDCTLTEA
jgi:hypothetical protein